MVQVHYFAVLHLRRVVAPTCGGRRLPALGRAICALGSLHMTISPQICGLSGVKWSGATLP